MTKATHLMKGLFGLVVPGGKSVMWQESVVQQAAGLAMMLRAPILSHKREAEGTNCE